MFNRLETLSISPILSKEFFKMSSKSEIKTKLTKYSKVSNFFFFFILHNDISQGEIKAKMCIYMKLGDTEKNLRRETGQRVYLVE